MSATAETATGQLAECTQPGCTWKGPVAEAPDHPCPWPSAAEGNASEEPIEEAPQAVTTPPEERRAWQDVVVEEVSEFTEDAPPFVIVVDRPEGDPQTIGYEATRDEADKSAVEAATRGGVIGEIHVEEVATAFAQMAEIERKRVQTETAAPERVLEDEQKAEPAPEAEEEPTSDEGAKGEPEPGEQTALIDRSQYDREDLALPTVDGEGVDKIRIAFSGSVMLDRMDPADVALFKRLKLRKEVELRVAGRVSGKADGYTTNREGDLDAVVETRTLKVETVYVLTPEEL